MNEYSQRCSTRAQRANYKELTSVIYNNYNIPVNYNELPKEFLEGVAYENIMLGKLNSFVDEYNGEYKKEKNDKFIWNKKRPYNKEMKQKYQEIKQKLILEGVIKTTWVSELELFKLVFKYYPTSIYQYRVKWLGAQSLDIYIPELKTAIEYQGIQHYEPIEHFGGEESFKYRKKLDEQKAQLCKKHGVRLIEWRYDESISSLILDKKLKEINKISVSQ